MPGYTAKILWVDLTSRTWEERPVPDSLYERHLSGVGLAAVLTSQHVPAGADPLGEDNLLGFVSGALTGTGALFGGRWLVTGKSPLTGGWGDANCGGSFGPALKQCGYDGIFVRGAASQPVYLYADGETVDLRDASALWGKDASETEERLETEAKSPRKARIACIGPAGEKLSLISGVVNDRGRLAGRSGLGAVMGSKRLKAVVLAGNKPIRSADHDAINRLNRECNALIPAGGFRFPSWILPLAGYFMSRGKRQSRVDGIMSLPLFRKWGTAGGTQVSLVNGDTPVRNWAGAYTDYHWRLLEPGRVDRPTIKSYHCYACPLGCGALQEGAGGFAESHRPEYESLASFGPLLLNADLDSLYYISEILNQAGMDSISAGATVAFAVECFENGLIDLKDTDGLRLEWGNVQAIRQLVESMIARQGIGDLLADGVRLAAQRIGSASERFAMHAGGQELPMHDPRYDPAYGTHYISEPTPGRHTVGSSLTYETLRLWTRVSWAPEAPRSYPTSDRYSASEAHGIHALGCGLAKMVIDGAGLCNFGLFLGVDRYPIFEYLNAAAGWKKTPDEYMEIGHRVQTMRQLFNLRQGVDPAQVTLPERIAGAAAAPPGAPWAGHHFDSLAMRSSYWQALGWDAHSGIPLPETLEKLGIDPIP